MDERAGGKEVWVKGARERVVWPSVRGKSAQSKILFFTEVCTYKHRHTVLPLTAYGNRDFKERTARTMM